MKLKEGCFFLVSAWIFQWYLQTVCMFILPPADEEFHLMTAIFEFVKHIQLLNIKESEMAMLSELILISSG